MVRPLGEIQDLLTDKSLDEPYPVNKKFEVFPTRPNMEFNVYGANDFEEWTVIDGDDLVIIEDANISSSKPTCSLKNSIPFVLSTLNSFISHSGYFCFSSAFVIFIMFFIFFLISFNKWSHSV